MIKFLTNMMAQLNESKKDNKGFTLVELIIVVAIIAVLATVLAPQYLQYVERSRESNDIQVAQNLMDAATVGVADPSTNVSSASVITVTWTTDADNTAITVTSSTSGESVTNLTKAITDVVGATLDSAESAVGIKQDFQFTIDVDSGVITVVDTESETNVDGWVELLKN